MGVWAIFAFVVVCNIGSSTQVGSPSQNARPEQLRVRKPPLRRISGKLCRNGQRKDTNQTLEALPPRISPRPPPVAVSCYASFLSVRSTKSGSVLASANEHDRRSLHPFALVLAWVRQIALYRTARFLARAARQFALLYAFLTMFKPSLLSVAVRIPQPIRWLLSQVCDMWLSI